MSNKIAIKKERAQLPSLQTRPLHMHNEENSRWKRNEACRADTLSKYGIVCSCDPKSPTHKIIKDGDFAQGYMMVVVPLSINAQWVREIKRFIRTGFLLPHNRKPFEIVNIHEGTNFGENLKNFIYGQRENLGLGTIVVCPATATVNSSLKTLRDEPKKTLRQQPSMIVFDEIQHMKDANNLPVQFVRLLIRRAVYPVHCLSLSGSPWNDGPSDFDVIESIALMKNNNSFPGWHGQDVYNAYVHRLDEARANLNESAKQVLQSDIIGRVQKGDTIQDEERTEAHEVLLSHDQRLRKYAIEVPMLQRKERSRYLGFHIPKNQPDSEKAKIVNCTSRMNNLQKAVANMYKEYLKIRYRHKVKYWSSRPEATRGPRPKVREVLFSLDSRVKVPDASRISLSLIGSAPGLATRVLKGTDPAQFRAKEANEVFAKTATTTQRNAVKNSLFWSLAQSAFLKTNQETGEVILHPKIDFICQTIERMVNDKEEHANGRQKRFGVLPMKMIICVPHAWQGALLTSYLFWKWPNRTFSFIGAANEYKERDDLLAPFQRPTDVAEDGRMNDRIVLISTYNIIGTGLNLTRCNYAIATSPLASMSHEMQLFGRINRKGQYAKTHCYVLLDHGNPVDVTTFHRMQRRTALTVPPDEIGTGLDFLLEDIDAEDSWEPDAAYDSGDRDSDLE